MTDNNVYLKGTGVSNDGGKNAKLDLHRGKLFPPLLLKGKKDYTHCVLAPLVL